MDKGLHFLFLSGILVTLLTPSSLYGEELGRHILSQIEKKSLFIQSYKAHFDLWMRVEGKEFSFTGTTLFKWPKRLRVEMALKDQEEIRQILYWDGEVVWQYLPSARIAFHRKEQFLREKFPKHFASQDLLNLQNPFDLVQSETIHFVDEERVNDETYYLFEGLPKKAIQYQGILNPALCRMRIAEKNGLLQDLEMYDGSGVVIVKQHFWDIQPNIELLEDEFKFKPEGIKLVEVTRHTENKMKLLLEEGKSP